MHYTHIFVAEIVSKMYILRSNFCGIIRNFRVLPFQIKVHLFIKLWHSMITISKWWIKIAGLVRTHPPKNDEIKFTSEKKKLLTNRNIMNCLSECWLSFTLEEIVPIIPSITPGSWVEKILDIKLSWLLLQLNLQMSNHAVQVTGTVFVSRKIASNWGP